MNTDTNLDKLNKFRTCLKNDEPIPISLKQWLIAALDNYYSGSRKSLPEAFGLAGSIGISSVATRHKKKVRDELISKLLMHNKESYKSWAAVKETSKMMNEYHRKKNRILKTNIENRSISEQLLVEIFEVDNNPPTSFSTINLL